MEEDGDDDDEYDDHDNFFEDEARVYGREMWVL